MYDLNKELRQGDFEIMFFMMTEQINKDLKKWQRKVDFYNALNDKLHNINASNDLNDEQLIEVRRIESEEALDVFKKFKQLEEKTMY